MRDQLFYRKLDAVKYWLGRQPNMEVLYMRYNEVLHASEGTSEIMAGFIGYPLDIQRMKIVPNEGLHRNRA